MTDRCLFRPDWVDDCDEISEVEDISSVLTKSGSAPGPSARVSERRDARGDSSKSFSAEALRCSSSCNNIISSIKESDNDDVAYSDRLLVVTGEGALGEADGPREGSVEPEGDLGKDLDGEGMDRRRSCIFAACLRAYMEASWFGSGSIMVEGRKK